MALGNITKTAVDRLAGGWLWDSGHREVVKGFGVRRQRDGTFYYLRYRIGGRQRMKSIGRHGSPWTPDKARNEARRLLGLIAVGTDPARQRGAETFGAAAERYLALREPAMKPRSFVENARHLRRDAKPLHSLALTEIDRWAIADRLARIETDSGPGARNRARSTFSAFFTWAIAEGLLEINPVTGTRKADDGGPRTRVLADAELAMVWRNLRDDRYGDIVRLLILTGQRREEIGGLMWSEVASVANGSTAPASILFPPERTKNGREHSLPLSRQAAAIIARQPRHRGEGFVFGGTRPYRAWSNSKLGLNARITSAAAESPVAAFRLHDLRRTVATRLGDKLGVLPHVTETILNHVSGHKAGVAGVYNLSRYEAETRDALQRWADYIDTLTGPTANAAPTPARPKALRLVRVGSPEWS